MQEFSFQTGTEIKRIILFLHGYGADGEDLLNIGKHWQDSLPHTLFVAPNAPYPHPQIPNGFMWFDFKDVSNITPEDIKDGLNKTRPIIQDYVQTLSRKYVVSLSQIIPVGFSQGAMIALDLLACEPEIQAAIDYAGIYYPMNNFIENATSKRALLVHGTDDTVVPYHHMPEAQKALTNLGIHVTPITCAELGHSINAVGILAGATFLKEAS
ncbi:MAG: dienelactone hydrolase family protein [Pseudomonadota bacterium]